MIITIITDNHVKMNPSTNNSLKNAGIAVMVLGAVIYGFSLYENGYLTTIIKCNDKLDKIHESLNYMCNNKNNEENNNENNVKKISKSLLKVVNTNNSEYNDC